VSTFTMRGVFIGVNGTSTDLERSVWCHVVAGWPAKPHGQPAEWSSLHRLSPPTQASPPRVDVWQPSLGPNHLKPWSASQPTPGPVWPGIWPTWYTCQIHPRGDDDFDIWSTSLCHLLKCSNLVPKFLKSDKH
jgi:hypothetical protein